MNMPDLLGGLLTGGVGGLFSGFLGVTSGGVLVPLLVLLLGKDQHVAQGISLVAQIFPTSLSGVRNYSKSGHRVSLRWLIWLAVGFCIGGGIGAILATHVADHALQWCFVAYLLVLVTLIVMRPPTAEGRGAATSRCRGGRSAALGRAMRSRRRRRLVIRIPRHRRRTGDHRADVGAA